MSSDKRIFILNGNMSYASLFSMAGFSIVFSPEYADIILFTGGEDVSPSLYGEEKHPRTFFSPERDAQEKEIFETYKGKKKMIGICRGGQFLNVMNGGKMFQHITEHTGCHLVMDTLTGEEIQVSSTHHQMMRPGPNALLVAIANNEGIKEHMHEGKVTSVEGGPDIEVLFYPETQCLCFQPHPEYYTWGNNQYKAMREYFFGLIKQYFNLDYRVAP